MAAPDQLFPSDRPEEQEIQLRVMDEHVTLQRWKGYDFATDYLTPTDGWSFVVGDSDLPEKEAKALRLGARIRLTVNGHPIADGFIDDIVEGGDKKSGKEWHVTGRDRLSNAVDSGALPTLKFNTGATLADVLKTLFAPYGWTSDDHFVIDNAANRDARTGSIRGTPTSHKGKPLKDYVVHQLKPHNGEGVFAFASRVAQRFGLWIWPTADGEKLVVSKPDFAQKPTYVLARTKDGRGNIISGHAKRSRQDQPSVLIADSFGGEAEYGKGRYKAYCVNPYFGVDDEGFVLPEVLAVLAQVPDAVQVTMTTQPFERRAPQTAARPLFLHDEESKTQEQVENFVRREMSLLLRKSFQYDCVVEGHGQIISGSFIPWAPDTVVQVYDEMAQVDELLWVLGVRFSKSKDAGTTTSLSLLRLNSVQFGEVTKEQATGPKPFNVTGLDGLAVINSGISLTNRILSGKGI